jgi:hypothetical protein
MMTDCEINQCKEKAIAKRLKDNKSICLNHYKLLGTDLIKNPHKCLHSTCKITPKYGYYKLEYVKFPTYYPINIPLFCDTHKLPKMFHMNTCTGKECFIRGRKTNSTTICKRHRIMSGENCVASCCKKDAVYVRNTVPFCQIHYQEYILGLNLAELEVAHYRRKGPYYFARSVSFRRTHRLY